jgi:putative ABC transport system permease protein
VVEEADQEEARAKVVSGDGILIARNLAIRFKLKVGDRFQVETPTGIFDKTIAGIIEDYTSEKGAIFIDRAIYQQFWRDSAVDMIEINLQPGVDRAAFKTELQRAVKGEHRAFIYTNAEYKQWIRDLIDGFFVLNYMQLAIAVLVSVLGIINTLIISVSERKRELGVLRALGGLRSQVRKLILLEAVAISFIGVVTGALAGAFNTYFLSRTAAMMVGGWAIPFSYPLWPILLTLPLAAMIAIAAAWWPAQRAVNLSVVEAIGYE